MRAKNNAGKQCRLIKNCSLPSLNSLSNNPIANNLVIDPLSLDQIFSKMGLCAHKDPNTMRQKLSSLKEIPLDTESLKNIKLPMLTFYVLIQNLKLKKCSDYDLISVKFKIEEAEMCNFPLEDVDHKHRVQWKLHHTFDFTMTEYTMRHTFAIIEVFDKFRHVIGRLKINMFTIWTGPSHLDFKMELPKAKLCRLSLDFKISQRCHLKIQNLMTELKLIDKIFPQERFTFSMFAAIGAEIDPSNYAYHLCVTEPQSKSFKNGIDQAQTHYVTSDKIIWLAVLGKKQPLPQFNLHIPYYDIYPSSLHLIFWKVFPGLSNSQLRYEMQSECFISLVKLLNNDYYISKDPQSALSYMDRTIDLEEMTWLHGTQVGKANIRLKFALQTHHKQMQACVLTEEGILVQSPVYNFQGEEGGQNIQILNLKKLSNQIQREFINMTCNQEERDYFDVMKAKIEIIRGLLERELKVLKWTNKQNCLIYEYKNENKLNEAQNLLIDLAFRALTYIREEKSDIQSVCWDILTTILKRGELTLGHLSFSRIEKDIIFNGKYNSSFVSKIQVSFKYQQLLNHLLKDTLKSLVYKGDQAKSYFAESFCSYAYFRIPLFRDYILQAIKREHDPIIPQWHGTEFNLYQDGKSQGDDIYQNLFDWQNNLWTCLQNDQRYQFNNQQLQMILKQGRWKQKLAKRQGAFFIFLQNLAKQIEHVSQASRYVKWHNLPGYSRLLHVFLVELSSMKVRSCNNRIKTCCTSLLANEKLLNPLINILLKKISINQGDTVVAIIQFINSLISSVQLKRRPFPSTFDYKFFLQRIRIVLEGELQFCTSQMLLLFYNHMETFAIEFSLELMLYLMSGNFFKFFFHWSHNLRNIFHALVCTFVRKFKPDGILSKINDSKRQILRVKHRNSNQGDHITYLKEAVIQRYQKIKRIFKEKIKPYATEINVDYFYDKDLFRKMRFKIRDKKEKDNLQILQNFEPLSNLKEPCSASSISSRTFLYFQEEEMILKPVHKAAFSYACDSLNEFTMINNELQKMLSLDPTYRMNVFVKKALDQKQLRPSAIGEQ